MVEGTLDRSIYRDAFLRIDPSANHRGFVFVLHGYLPFLPSYFETSSRTFSDAHPFWGHGRGQIDVGVRRFF